MKGTVITMATLWVDLSDGKTQISGTQPTAKSVPVHEISVKDKKQTLVYRSTIPDFYKKIVRLLMGKQIQKGQVSTMQNFPDLLVLYFQKDKDRDRIAQMAMTCSYFVVEIKPNVLIIGYDIDSTSLDIDQAVDIEKYDIEDLNKGSSGMVPGGGGGKKGPLSPGPPPPKPEPDPKKFNEDNPPLTDEGSPGGECSGEGCEGCASGECSGPGSGEGSGEGSGAGGEGSGEGSGEGEGEGSGEGEGEGEGDGDGDGDPSEDGKPSPCEECSQEAKDQNASLDPAIDLPKDAMEKAKAATDAALEAEAKADPDSESDKKAVDEAKEAAREAIDKARVINDEGNQVESVEEANNEKLDDMEDSLTSDFEKLAQEIQDELEEIDELREDLIDVVISNTGAMDLVRKLIKLKSLATPQDRGEVERIENEIKTKIALEIGQLEGE